MEIGVSTFVETTPGVQTGDVIRYVRRLRDVVDEIVRAVDVGLDVFGVGEHHRKDYAASSPVVVLAVASRYSLRRWSSCTNGRQPERGMTHRDCGLPRIHMDW